MVRPDIDKWGQTIETIRRLGVEAEHKRTRERFWALYMIGTEQSNATCWAQETGRNPRTVMDWVHLYNRQGPTALTFQQTGGRAPLFAQKKSSRSSIRSRTVSQ
jgi:hypothetical protein